MYQFNSGHNANGAFFTEKGCFTSQGEWTMQDKDLYGNLTMRVEFQFLNYTDVILEGFNNNQNSLWKTSCRPFPLFGSGITRSISLVKNTQ
jgi:hypothetical protein